MVLIVTDDADPAAAAAIGRIAEVLRADGYHLPRDHVTAPKHRSRTVPA
jgi:hypothetical protein